MAVTGQESPNTVQDKPEKRLVTVRLDADAPRSRQIDVPLEEKPRHAAEPSDKRYRWHYPVQVALFFTVLFIGAIVAWILPWRPTYSDMEQRELTKFPAFSASEALSKGYYDKINTWFADTFPGRETWVKLNGQWKGLYGLSDTKMYGQVADADDIPDVPSRDTPQVTVPPATDRTTAAASTAATTSTTAATSTTASSTSTTASAAKTTTKTTAKSQTGDHDKWNGDNGTVDQGQTLNGILVMGNTAYEYYSFSQSTADAYVSALNRAADKLNGKASVYDIIVPTSIGVMLPENLRAKINSSDQERAINYMYGSMSGSVHVVPILQVLRDRNDEYLYFHTDHHWTARGAYYAYSVFMQLKGQTPTPLSAYEKREFTGFFGSFFAETQSPDLMEDTVVAYLPTCDNKLVFTDKDGQEIRWNVIHDVTDWSARYKYNTFIGGDNPFTEITNLDRSDGTAALVIKESFGNAFVPFLVDHYEKVYVVDYRYYDEMKLAQVVDTYHIQDVIFMNNVGATRSSSLVSDIADFVGG